MLGKSDLNQRMQLIGLSAIETYRD